MADKTLQMTLEGLAHAVAVPQGQPLHGSKASPGLFPSTAAGKHAAQQCKEAGYLTLVRTETRGKSHQEVCAITEKGIAFLLSQLSPKPVLEEFVRAIEARGQQVNALVETARQCQGTFEALKAQVAKVLAQVKSSFSVSALTSSVGGNGPSAWKTEALTYLSRWLEEHPDEDCPLPDLYAQARCSAPALSIGQFHDGLRQLHDQGQVYLHPWTGPLYEIPEPAVALLMGHAVVYYVSRKS